MKAGLGFDDRCGRTFLAALKRFEADAAFSREIVFRKDILASLDKRQQHWPTKHFGGESRQFRLQLTHLCIT